MTQPRAALELRRDEELRRCCSGLIEDRFGLCLSAEQSATLERLMTKAAQESGFESPWKLYQAFVDGQSPALLESLVTQLTVGETHFFRIGPQIDALRGTVLSDIISRRRTERRLRIWVAGGSTGEEPYTLAILLREQLPALHEWDVQLLASDISRPALDAAERAAYGAWSFRDTPDEVRERYFRRQGSRWHLADTVRRMVEFAQVNLANEPLEALGLSPDSLDLILCRNVTIYFSRNAAQRLYHQFAIALVPEGWLILGPSDPAPERHDALQARYLQGAVLWQREGQRTSDIRSRQIVRYPNGSAVSPAATRPIRRTATRTSRPVGRAPQMQPAAAPPRNIDRLRALARQDRRAAREQAEALAREGTLEAEVYALLGMLHLDEGAVSPAIEALRRATFLQHDRPLAYFGLATAYRQIGQGERARAALLHARRLLSALPATSALADTDGMTVEDLRHAVEVQLMGAGGTGA